MGRLLWVLAFAVAWMTAGCGGRGEERAALDGGVGGGGSPGLTTVAQFDLRLDTQNETVQEVVVDDAGQVISAAEDVTRFVRPRLRAVHWYPRSKRIDLDIALRNCTQRSTFYAPMKVVVKRMWPRKAEVLNPDGEEDGKPYWDYSGVLGDGRLQPNEVSEAKRWRIFSPLWGIVVLRVRVLAQTEAAPPVPEPLPATVWAVPDQVAFNYPAQSVSLYVQLPPGCDPSGIDVPGVLIGGWLAPETAQIVDVAGIPTLQLEVTGFTFVRSLEKTPGEPLMSCSVAGDTYTDEGWRHFMGYAQVNLQPPPEAWVAWPGPPRVQVQNPGFETDGDNDGAPDKWWYFDSDIPGSNFVSPMWDNATSHGGAYSARVDVAANCTVGPDNGYRQWVAVRPGDTRTVSLWAKASGLTANRAMPGDMVTAELTFFDKSGNQLNLPNGAWIPAGEQIGDDTDWTQMSTGEWVAPANTVVVQIDLLLVVNAGVQAPTGQGAITAWFDDVACE